ncbi:MAG: HAMP domain-containing methyl-accepting chemotaxis protein [Myxococcota bacterium]|nr:HAMP domain-containing methyl-accepting chemotaxis protein [Myxococcota bacterium]
MLPGGGAFSRRIVNLSLVYSALALLLLLPALHALLDLTAEQWWWLLGCTGTYAALSFYPQVRLLERAIGAVPNWLDARARGESLVDRSRQAFADVVDLPRRCALLCVFGWSLPVLLVSMAMELRWPAWGPLESLSLILAGIEAGFIASFFLLFRVKREVEPVRMALAAELQDPEVRATLVRPTPLRDKLALSVTALAVMPVFFAGLLFQAMASRSLERFATGWQRSVLEASGGSLEGSDGRAGPEGRSLADQLEITLVDPSSTRGELGGLEPHVLAELQRALERGERSGSSVGIPSERVFAWSRQDTGEVLVASLPASAVSVDARPMWITLLVLLLGSGGIACAVALLLAGDVARATSWLRREAERLASGDLRPGPALDGEDELGELSRSFEGMGRSLRETLTSVSEAVERVEGTASEMVGVAGSVRSATGDQVANIHQTRSTMEAITQQVRGIADSAHALNASVEESGSSILELGAAGQELNQTSSALSDRVHEVSSSIEHMVGSVRQVLESTESLADAAVETSASMGEMATSVRGVDASAEETARLSRQVVDAAESGQSRMVQTIEGMDAIREATETAEQVIRSLGGRASEIGAIVDVIDDVADETNLLALNAAIIAAQAGEHGRAFSVVADEIKDLADRVLASTKEIGSLIRAVQDESANAIGAIEKGAQSVASGVDLAAEAGLGLEEITRASRESGERIAGIVSAVREQARAASHVVELMERVRGGVEEIRAASVAQDRGNQVIHRSSTSMRELAQQVGGTIDEQARGSGRIRESVEGVRTAVEQIGEALREQSAACRSAVELLEAMNERTRANEEGSQRLDLVARDLVSQAENLRRDVRRFQLG